MAVRSAASDPRTHENARSQGAELFDNERPHDSVSLAGTDLPRRLARLMSERGVVPEDITRESHVPVGTIMSILRGNKPTTRVKTIRRLARHFDMTPEELLGGRPRRVRAHGLARSAFLTVCAAALIGGVVVAWPRLVPGEPSLVADGRRVVVSRPGRAAPLWEREFEARVSAAQRAPWDADFVIVGTDAAGDAPAAVSLFDFRRGERLWSHPLEHDGPRDFSFADVDGDGVDEVLAIFSGPDEEAREIRVFTRSGESRGSFVAH